MYKMIPIFVGICKNSHIFPCKFYTIYFNRKKSVCVGGGWRRRCVCVCVGVGGGLDTAKKKTTFLYCSQVG